MNVLFQSRKDAFAFWGGDTTQMVQTQRGLQQLGVDVEVNLEQAPDVKRYDLVHVFNVQTAAYQVQQVRNARAQQVPVVVSPIYWDSRHLEMDRDRIKYCASPRIRLLARINWRMAAALHRFYRRLFFDLWGRHTGRERLAIEMLDGADMILPNSIAELEILAVLFNRPELRARAVVVPNGVTPLPSKQDDSGKEVSKKIRDLPSEYVLEVGAVHPTKGQRKVIEALTDHPDIPLVFIGRPEPGYWEDCQKCARRHGNVQFIPEVKHEYIGPYYKQAKVHVLPSLRESPGLVTLEAALQGANCVVSIHGPVQEYFGADAWCCDPSSLNSIRDAVLAAWRAPRNTRLRERILRQFTWKEAARITRESYLHVLSSCPRRI